MKQPPLSDSLLHQHGEYGRGKQHPECCPAERHGCWRAGSQTGCCVNKVLTNGPAVIAADARIEAILFIDVLNLRVCVVGKGNIDTLERVSFPSL